MRLDTSSVQEIFAVLFLAQCDPLISTIQRLEMKLSWYSACLAPIKPGSIPDHINWMSWYMSTIPVLGKQRQEDQEFQVK